MTGRPAPRLLYRLLSTKMESWSVLGMSAKGARSDEAGKDPTSFAGLFPRNEAGKDLCKRRLVADAKSRGNHVTTTYPYEFGFHELVQPFNIRL